MHRLSTTDWAVLTLLHEGEVHGFRVAAVFAPKGELGGIWTIQRPQVYRALEHLVGQNLAQPIRVEAGEAGPNRTLFGLTPSGQALVEDWLLQPVQQLRYGRSDLRLKIVFLLRQGQGLNPLLEAQRAVYQQTLAQLQSQLETSSQTERVSLLWRLEMAHAGLRFVEQLLVKPPKK